MSFALEIARARLLHRESVSIKNSPPVKQEIRDKVSKIFSPYKMEQGQERNPEQFYRDAQGKERVLAYNGQTIYVQYKNEHDEIEHLEERQAQVMRAQRTDNSEANQKLYDGLQDQIDSQTAALKGKIRKDFGDFLTSRLGPTRLHLIPEITYRFSQKAFTTFIRQVNDHTTRKYGGIFVDGRSEETCALHIPEDPQGAVLIDTSTRGIYQNFIPVNQFEKASRPAELVGHAVYTIGLGGNTEADVDFLLADY